ncbi:MAG: histidinol-phosphatase [bacterium]
MTPRSGARELSGLLEFAVELAHRAGRSTLEHFGASVQAQAKPDGTPVTAADRGAERLLRQGIVDRFSDDAVVGEEFGEERPGGRYCWILDPIDGTRSFVRGVPLYAVLVGLLDDGEAVLGVIHFPALSETVAAARGQGCFLDGVRTQVNSTATLDTAVALTSDPRDVATSVHGEGWRRLTSQVDYVRGWGDAYGHALVATGRAEVMVDPELEVWDAAPLLPVLEEAGGRFTTLSGEARIDGGSGVSTNGVLHPAVLDLLSGRAPTG